MANHPNRSRRSNNSAANPTPGEIRAAREKLGLDYMDAGSIVHSSARAWQSWELGDRRMHPAIWELFQIKTRRPPKKETQPSVIGLRLPRSH